MDRTEIVAPPVHQLEPKRVIDVWFEDGNCIIEAEDYQFCLLKSFLTKRSPIFQDTFSMPQPEDAECVNGLPVLHIHDSAADAAHFFKAIFDSEFDLLALPRGGPAPTSFEKVAAILRLSTKYEVEYLRALQHLSLAYPISLPLWKACETSLTTFPVFPSALATINLAREVDCTWVLPTALYDYCKFTGPAEIFSGTVQDGVLLSLSDADKQLCLEARESQKEASKDMESFLTSPLPADCTGDGGCAVNRLTWTHILNKRRQDGFWLDPTEAW
ncbi:hypothetical protein DFH07DRAFT_910993 [Mycena maculata]|uniref:BTB domain-containing protein n=1 Tax=Mycena maculata TaxID=230809 RepID=A0AAD7NWF1_9AGAR|nr:hypothetical protein DFH07DRAFT_910993 [Mycena maculata]